MENPFVGIAAALFDLDGTLVETHIDFPLMKREMLRLAACYGVEPDGMAGHDILAVVEESRDQLIRAGRIADGGRLRTEAFALLERIEIEQCANPFAIPGARVLLQTLCDSGVRIGVVTRNCAVVARNLLAFDEIPYDALITRDDVPRTKPDPSHLLATLEALGFQAVRRSGGRAVGNPLQPEPGFPTAAFGNDDYLRCCQRIETDLPEPLNAVMVGDNWMDVAGGHAAGLLTVGILRGKPADHFDRAVPDLLVGTIADLAPLAVSAVSAGNVALR